MHYIFLLGRRFSLCLLSIVLLISCASYKTNSNVRIFPLQNYNQNADFWLNPDAPDYKKNLLDSEYQAKRFMQLKSNYYGTDKNSRSPWSENYINSVLGSGDGVMLMQEERLVEYNNESTNNDTLPVDSQQQIDHKRFYGINFQSYNQTWFDKLDHNINLGQFNRLRYRTVNRAIIVTNLAMRSLPSSDPFFYDHQIAGEGYPFDNLQQTIAFAGTPAYVLGHTLDKAWSLILTPDYIGWVDSSGVAMADSKFIALWQKKADANLVGISKSNIGIQNQYGQYVFSGFVGMLFPLKKLKANNLEVLIPTKLANGVAQITVASLTKDSAVILPLAASKKNFAIIIKALQGRPYGWGGYGFYNDCSAEMKAVFTMFGVALPRNAKYQALTGTTTDLSGLSEESRLNMVMQKAKPLLTLIYIKGHILLYVGKYKGANGKEFPLSYQEMWGLKPRDQRYRLIVGKSVFFPLLAKYPEDENVVSHAGWGTFILVDLSGFPANN